MRKFHAIFKFLVFVFVGIIGPLDSRFRSFLKLRKLNPREKYQWATLWAAVLRWNFGIRVHNYGGNINPDAQLLVSNHLGYLDIISFLKLCPMNFVSKSDVEEWPLVGWLADCAGTLFLNREKKSDIPKVLNSFNQVLESRSRVIFFPEGTSSGGSSVLPFHSSLFHLAAKNEWVIQTLAIKFTIPKKCEGSASERVCYWGDMEFVDHFKQMILLPRIDCHIYINESVYSGKNRKVLAADLNMVVSKNLDNLKSLIYESTE